MANEKMVNPETFDLIYLWNQTTELVRALPAPYTSRYYDGETRVYASVAWDGAGQERLVCVDGAWLDDATPSRRLATEIHVNMGGPDLSQSWIYDRASALSPDPATQHQIARRFLDTYNKITLNPLVIKDICSTPEGKIQFNELHEVPNRKNMSKLAVINLGLATLLGRQTIEYEEILEQAKTWSPPRVRPYPWL
ncbi:MAG TPA: hypothetical protein VF733_05130 [Candidatus Saccharimonadales bacterium]